MCQVLASACICVGVGQRAHGRIDHKSKVMKENKAADKHMGEDIDSLYLNMVRSEILLNIEISKLNEEPFTPKEKS